MHMSLWLKYKNKVRANFRLEATASTDITYWRNRFFSNTIIYAIPFSLIAYIPGVYYSWVLGLTHLVVIDTVTVLLLVAIGFVPQLSLIQRKALFIFLIYFLAANLLYLIGPVGPGLLYMLGASFFSIIIFPNRYSFYPSFINIVICALVACVIPYDLFPWHNAPEHSVWLWIAVTSNLIFLSLVSAALIPRVFNSLERALRKEQEMRIERDQQNQLLEATLKELKQKNKDLEQFALVASHDLQEPLRMITGFLTQLNKKYGHQLDATAHQYIDFASDGAKRMRQIIQDLLEYARIDHSKATLEKIDVNQLIDEIRILQRKVIEEKSATIHTSNLPIVENYRVPLLQIFHNLIANALKYSKADRPIEVNITATESPTEWIFSVQDNGIGIDPKNFDKIFILFERLHGRSEYSGTGMGLAIVKKVIENLKEKIWVTSEPDKGATFYFSIRKTLP